MDEVCVGQISAYQPKEFEFEEYEHVYDQATIRSNDNLIKLLKSSVWSDRYNGYSGARKKCHRAIFCAPLYEIIIETLKKDDFGISSLKQLNIDFAKFLDEPNSLASRKAYKAVSIYVKIERSVETLKKCFYSIVKQCLTGGVSNRFTYRYAVRIICQLFEKLSNVDDLNRTILIVLQEFSKNVKTIQGLLKLLNLFVCKYGPEKIDTKLFIDQISEYSSHPVDKIRDESLKFFLFIAKWNENTESIIRLAGSSLK